MENEVIIDGCNVAECMFVQTDHYLETPCCIMKIARNEVIGICKNRPNCYFKQLQRAKAESEQYKKDIKDGVGCIQCKKELENDTLHITIEKLKADLSQAETSLYAWKAENEKLKLMLSEKYGVFK